MINNSSRIYRDSLFRYIFSGRDDESKKRLLSLYNAINGSNHTDIADLKVTTIENVIYITMKNDLSFLIDSMMYLCEQQSSVNPNMPLRGLMYFAQLYQMNLSERGKDLYGSSLVKIPSPRFLVFYNGNAEMPDSFKYRLSDAFDVPDSSADFEWTATVLNINKNHNPGLQKSCKPLYDYTEYVNRVKENLKTKARDAAVQEAVDYAIRQNLLDGFFKKQKMEILNMSLTEFNQEEYDRNRREEGYNEGKEAGARQKAVEAALAFLKKNIPPETVAECIGLPLEKVLELQKQITEPA